MGTTMPTNANAIQPQNQDYLVEVGIEGERHKGNLLVHDLVNLHCKLSLLSGSKSGIEFESLAKHIVGIIHDGSAYTLPSSIPSSESFFTGGGRFLKKEKDSWNEISDTDAIELLSTLMKEELNLLETAGYGKEDGTEQESSKDKEKESEQDTETEGATTRPRTSRRQKLNSGQAASATGNAASTSNEQVERMVATKPNVDDIVLLDRKDATEKTYVDHAGNALLIHEVSQFFTDQYMLSKAMIKGTRADASLATVYALLGPAKDVGSDGVTATKTRFLLRPKGVVFPKSSKNKEITETWEVLSYNEATEFILMLLFDKLVDKENIAAVVEKPAAAASADDKGAAATSTAGPSKVPVKGFTDHDVLFGRGGLTNSHPGNRRFRDIILLHRPDYIRAIKIEKPNVARKIVKAIRCGSPPGRFLKKDPKNGMWYDVGDRHAAEKTSQALREKTQAEKAARFDEDKRKRLREGGLSQLASQRGQRMYPVLPLPTLSPADLQRMVQAPYNMAGVPLAGPFGNAAVPLNGAVGTEAISATTAGAKPATMPGVSAETTVGDDSEQKKAALQEPVDAEGNIVVTDSDVISGRGGRSNHHPGNKRFRDIVALHRPDYVRAAKIHKPAVARMIVRALRNSDPPGRFLKKDEKTGKWYDVGDKKAAEKASQALREKTPEERDRRKNEAVGGMPPSYFANPALFDATARLIHSAIPGLGPPLPPPGVVAAAAGPVASEAPTEQDAAATASKSDTDKNGTGEEQGVEKAKQDAGGKEKDVVEQTAQV